MRQLAGTGRHHMWLKHWTQFTEAMGARTRALMLHGLVRVWHACEPGRATSKAPICCVMPPASLAATAVLRSASSREVCTAKKFCHPCLAKGNTLDTVQPCTKMYRGIWRPENVR